MLFAAVHESGRGTFETSRLISKQPCGPPARDIRMPQATVIGRIRKYGTTTARQSTGPRTSRIEILARARGCAKSVVAKFRDCPVHQGSDGIRTAAGTGARLMSSRLRIQPGDVPASVAAQRMGVSAETFSAALPNLISRGFPKPDPDTGNFDLDAIDAWRRLRHPHLFAGRGEYGAVDASTVVQDRIAALRGGSR
jgi:hypothetical protein